MRLTHTNPPSPSADSTLRAKHASNDQKGMLNNISPSLIASWIRAGINAWGSRMNRRLRETKVPQVTDGKENGLRKWRRVAKHKCAYGWENIVPPPTGRNFLKMEGASYPETFVSTKTHTIKSEEMVNLGSHRLRTSNPPTTVWLQNTKINSTNTPASGARR